MKAKAKTDINAQNWIEVFDNLISHLNLKPVEAIESLQKEKLEETYL
jgi:hypothetical protein